MATEQGSRPKANRPRQSSELNASELNVSSRCDSEREIYRADDTRRERAKIMGFLLYLF